MVNWEERRLMVKVANLYYFDGRTQAEIAKAIGVSRPVISKLLTKAKEQGIVEIYIKDENAHTVELEQRLIKKFGLNEVIVIPTSDLTEHMVKRALGKTAASYVSKNLSRIESLGISWGSTLSSFVQEYPYERHENLKIVPLVGGMGRKLVEIHSNLLAYRLAQKLNCQCSYLYAPAMADTIELKERLEKSEDISMVIEEGRNVQMAVVGIGNPLKNSTMQDMNYLKETDIQDLKKAGVVGDIGSRFFDASGKQVEHPLNNLVVGLDLSDLKKIPQVIGIVSGLDKIDSIKGALSGNYIQVLILDDITAQALSES